MRTNYFKRLWNRILFQRIIKTDESKSVVESMAKARMLYKELIPQAHPDRHPEKTEIAEELTKRINENRYNYTELLKIKYELEQIFQ